MCSARFPTAMRRRGASCWWPLRFLSPRWWPPNGFRGVPACASTGNRMLGVDVEKRLGDFFLSARFQTGDGVTALFGPSGARKTTLGNMISGLVGPDRGRSAIDEQGLADSAK